jgi:hypothetical protein
MNLIQWSMIQHLSLEVKEPITQWPSRLKSLNVTTHANQSWDQLPETLTKLVITVLLHHDDQSYDYLPCGLTHLVLTRCQASLDYLPVGLKVLHIGDGFNQPIGSSPQTFTSFEYWPWI